MTTGISHWNSCRQFVCDSRVHREKKKNYQHSTASFCIKCTVHSQRTESVVSFQRLFDVVSQRGWEHAGRKHNIEKRDGQKI